MYFPDLPDDLGRNRALRAGVVFHGRDLPGLGIDLHRLQRIARDRARLRAAIEELERQAEWDRARADEASTTDADEA